MSLESDLRQGNPTVINQEKPVLILTVGLPQSGKSTWARKQGVPVVSMDAVRMAMHGKPFIPEAESWVHLQTKTMVKALFYAGHFVVILDACNHTCQSRASWLRINIWRVAFMPFYVTGEICRRRAKANHRDDLVPVIKKMASELEYMYVDEGPTLNDVSPL